MKQHNTTQANSVKFQSELPKVGFEDEKSDVSQVDPSSTKRVNTDSHVQLVKFLAMNLVLMILQEKVSI